MTYTHQSLIKRMRLFQRYQPTFNRLYAAELHAEQQLDWETVYTIRDQIDTLRAERERKVSHWSYNQTQR